MAPRGTVTLAFSDIEGSTSHWERLGEKFSASLARHNEIIRASFARFRGFEVKTEGDSFMVAFASADDAARFALAAQEALAREAWPAEVGDVRVRIGLHVGEPLVVEEAGRVDYLGPVVNRAARIAQAAHGGQILMSEAARAAAAGGLTDASLVDLGDHRLRSLERRERLWQALPKSLASRRFPAPVTLTGAATNLPAPANSFVGREREVRDIAALLETARLVSLTGPGGTGKTRLALRVGAEVLDRFPAGVWFVDLTETRDAAGVSQSVAAALGVPVTGCCPPEVFVGDLLELRGELLLILDNFEQVVEAAPATVAAWLRRAPKTRILATSRFLLNVAGEREVALEPLPSPSKPGVTPTVADVAAHDATRLFLERAREADPSFALTPQNAPDVAALCADLDGMPLALELAAARIRILSPAQIVSRLADRFKILTSTRRDQTARQRSLEGAIEWSWALLSDWERSAFSQLCTFHGGFFLEAAEAVLDLCEFVKAPPAVDVVQQLREKSFLRAAETPFGVRYSFYVALRDFGEARLAPEAKRSLAARRGGWFCDAAEHLVARINTPDGPGALVRLELERDNLLAVIDAAIATDDPSTAARATLALDEAFAVRGQASPRVALLARVLAFLPPGPAVPSLRVRFASSLADAGDPRAARESALRALREAREAGPASADILNSAAIVLVGAGEQPLAHELWREAAVRNRAEGNPRLAVSLKSNEAVTLEQQGRPAEALEAARECLALARALGSFSLLGLAHFTLGTALRSCGRVSEALENLAEAARQQEAMGAIGRVSLCRTTGGRLLAHFGRAEEGLALIRRGIDELARTGDRQKLLWARLEEANALFLLGRNAEATARFDDILRQSREAGFPRLMCLSLLDSAYALFRAGDIEAADRRFTEAVGMPEMQVEERELGRALIGQGHVLHHRLQFAAACDRYAAAEALFRRRHDRPNTAVCMINRASVMAEEDRFDESLAAATAALEIVGEWKEPANVLHARNLRIQALLGLGRAGEAEVEASSALPMAEAGGGAVARFRASIGANRAAALVALGRNAEAVAEAARTIEAVQTLGWPGPVAAPDEKTTLATLRRIAGSTSNRPPPPAAAE